MEANLPPTSRVHELKQLLFSEVMEPGENGEPRVRVTLIHGGRRLQDHNTLANCRVKDGDAIHAVLQEIPSPFDAQPPAYEQPPPAYEQPPPAYGAAAPQPQPVLRQQDPPRTTGIAWLDRLDSGSVLLALVGIIFLYIWSLYFGVGELIGSTGSELFNPISTTLLVVLTALYLLLVVSTVG